MRARNRRLPLALLALTAGVATASCADAKPAKLSASGGTGRRTTAPGP